MEAKFFGNFLVNRGIITTDQLVHALVEQAKSLPPTLQIVFEKGLLTQDQWLAVFETQVVDQTDFTSACRKLNLWTSELDKSIKAEVDKVRIPLGQVLLRAKAIDLKNLTKMLDEFLSRVEMPSVAASPVTVAPAPAAAPAVTLAVAASASPAEVAKPVVESGILADFAEFFTDERLSGLQNLLDMMTSDLIDEKVFELLIADCRVELHTLRGVSVCLQLNEMTKLLGAFEDLVSTGKQNKFKTPGYKDFVKEKGTLLAGLIFELRNMVLGMKTESEFVQARAEQIKLAVQAA